MNGFMIASAVGQAVETSKEVATKAAASGGVMELKGIEGAFFISLVDMTVVFAVLGVIALVMVALARAVRWAEEGPVKAATPEPVRNAPAAVPGKDELDEETVAVITAAVAAVMAGRRYRIARLAGYDIQTARWAMAGRQKLLMKG